jgi:hypothetical protein
MDKILGSNLKYFTLKKIKKYMIKVNSGNNASATMRKPVNSFLFYHGTF